MGEHEEWLAWLIGCHAALTGGDYMSPEQIAELGEFIQRERNRQPAAPAWECAAQRGVSDPPQDCDWPLCGCDPAAARVVEALRESGWRPQVRCARCLLNDENDMAEDGWAICQDCGTWLSESSQEEPACPHCNAAERSDRGAGDWPCIHPWHKETEP